MLEAKGAEGGGGSEIFLVQLWECSACGAVRQWGNDHPDEPTMRALLLCEGTCAPAATIHTYHGVR